MELYCKEFVYFDWDDKLKGKKGFFGDSINHIKENVKGNRTMWYGEICHNVNTNTDYPFRFIDDSGSSHCFRFCYYDPYYEFRKAYLEGKQLQFKISNGNWLDVEGEPLFYGDEYRIKPESESVPFDTLEGFITKWEGMNPGCTNRPECTMPMIWVKNKLTGSIYLIDGYDFKHNDVGIDDCWFSLEDMFKKYTFLDGSLIGKVKE